MQKIEVLEAPKENIVLEFVWYSSTTKRLWIRDLDAWFQTIGWCPHININGNECVDCALNIE